MNIYYPQYYKDFRCIASSCPDSCCHEWQVDVDADSAAFYRSLPGDLGARLRSVLLSTDGGVCMENKNGRCPMWRDDGLCRIQAELGHDALCHTCRIFPRLRHDYGDFAELGLELSCPEAARLILTCDPAPCQEVQAQAHSPEYDPAVMEILKTSRETLRSFIRSSTDSVPRLLTVLLLYAHHVQSQIDGGPPVPFDPGRLLAQAQSYPLPAPAPLQVLDFFKSLELLTPRWHRRLETPAPAPWQDAYRPLIRYLLDRYWLQAVSDLDLICRAKLMVTTCILLRTLGGDLLETAQLFSKEIENDPDNVEAILDGAYTAPALTDLHLLSLLTEH